MDTFLKTLINSDTKLVSFTTEQEIIHQGLAPLLAQTNRSITIQKANLLEINKFQNWQEKARLIFKEFNKNNIEFLVFKGFAFSFLLYKNTHLRPYSDIDIIIDKENYQKVNTILLELGYIQLQSRQGQFVSFQNSFYDENSPQAVIDVHWQINNRIEFHRHFPFQALHKKAIQVTTDNINFKSLSLIDAFILGCFHYQAHRPNDRNHIWLYDLTLLWKKMNQADQKKCIDKSRTSNQSQIVLATLQLMNETFVNCISINFDLNELNSEATEYYLNERKNKITDIKTRLSHITGFKNKILFISEYIFQNKTYVKRRFGVKSNLWVYLYYPKMWIEDIFKLFK
jgi:hypothetical protein